MLWIIAIIAVLLVMYISYNTLTLKVPEVNREARPYKPTNIDEASLKNLSKAISIKTISRTPYSQMDFNALEEFISFLESTYVNVHKQLELTRVNGYGLVYRWRGKDAAKKPLLLLAHYDVVPVEEGTQKDWKRGPFSGAIHEDALWGRGTLDIKSQLMAILEAVEKLLKEGATPGRDIYLAFGQDEEVGGMEGAYKIAELFEAENISFEAVFDEGGTVISDALEGVKVPMALVGIGEKGYVNLKLTAAGSGGHSSMPPKNTALGRLAKAITLLEEKPMKRVWCSAVRNMLEAVSGEMGLPVKIAMANFWLFKPLLNKILSSSATTNAMIRTTTAVTMAKGSDAANVLPQKAEAVINARLIPGDSSQDLINHIKRVTKGLVEVEALTVEEPSDISPIDTLGYRKLTGVIKEFYPNALVAPYLVMGGTDSRKYSRLSKNIYRFTPYLINSEEKDTMHSTDEHISIENYMRMIEFYIKLIRSFD